MNDQMAEKCDGLTEYDGIRDLRKTTFSHVHYGDPAASSEALFKVVDSDKPPLRLILGEFGTRLVPQIYEQRLKLWAEWADVSRAADGGSAE